MSHENDLSPIQPPKKVFDMGLIDIAWCPGCGNFGILQTLKNALQELGRQPKDVCLVSGIGQAAKTPQYLKANFFNGLHGRAIPPATGIKAANPHLDVVVTSGDGCTYGEGGNHFIHAIRRNPNITLIVHDNMIYGLTKGQASPTSPLGMVTNVQTTGVTDEPFNPIATAIALDASFVARASIHDMNHTKEIVKQAIEHKGLSIVNIFQPCVTFNKINTYQWLQEATYKLPEDHDVHDRVLAFSKAIETEKYPLGIYYKCPHDRPVFEDMMGVYDHDDRPLFQRELNVEALQQLFKKPPAIHQATVKVKEVRQETPDVKSFILERPDGFTYKAGQYIMIGFPDKRRINEKINVPMTLASSPHEDTLMVTVKRNTDYTSALLDEVNVGSELLITGPLGTKLCVDQLPTKDVVFLSGGSGITPFRSILRYAIAKKLPHKFTLINGNRKFEDIIYREELDQMSREYDHIFTMNSLDQPRDDWQGECGCITKEMLEKYVDFNKDVTFLLCGPPKMVECMIGHLESLGVHASRIIKEDWEIAPASSDSGCGN
jgi:2-oxoglutarate ferredoxin oxidoreductase subunit beta